MPSWEKYMPQCHFEPARILRAILSPLLSIRRKYDALVAPLQQTHDHRHGRALVFFPWLEGRGSLRPW
jgi:hypothetical protein